MAAAVGAALVRPAVGRADDGTDQSIEFIRNVSDPQAIDSNAALLFEQRRSGWGRPVGDPMVVVRDASMGDPYRVQTYITDNGAFESGRWIVVSQKRQSAIGGDPASGAFIQGVSSVPDGSEPSMIAASTDSDGPAFAGEAYTRKAPGHRNISAFAAYDLDSISGGSTPYSPGFGRKKFVIRGDGGLWWGEDLRTDIWANSDVRLERPRRGTLRLFNPQPGQAKLVVEAADGSQALALSRAGKLQAEFVVNEVGNAYLTIGSGRPLRFYRDWSGLSIGDRDVNKVTAPTLSVFALGSDTGVLDLRMVEPARASFLRIVDPQGTTLSGVDATGAFFDRVEREAAGPPRVGTHATGACLLNLADARVYWCIAGGAPGTWRSVELQ